MNVRAVCEFLVVGETQNLLVRCHGKSSVVYFEVQLCSYIPQGLE